MQKIDQKKLLQLASEAAENAYSPYSNFRVGACALFEDESTYKGCNVENSSYGLTICAERNALSSSVIDGGKKKLIAIAICSPDTRLCFPCGACRQWMVEFSSDAIVILEDTDGNPVEYKVSDLLPHSFDLHNILITGNYRD